MIDTKPNILIDAEFCGLIPPLNDEERAGLEESLKTEGCRDALVTWRGLLLDGHNRYELCERHGIEFKTVAIGLPDREAACDWIDANQLCRRNLTPDQQSLLRGRRYNRTKKSQGGDRKSNPQNEGLNGATAKRLAKQHGVSRATIERDGQFAGAVDKVKKVDPEIEAKVTAGKAPPKAAVVKAAELLDKHPERAKAVLHGKAKTSDVVREIKRETLKAKLEDVSAKAAKAASGIYDVVVIDPPWPMEKIERDVRPNQSEMDYPTMDEAALSAMKVPTTGSAHVWLWTTHRFLPMALRLLDQWGMKYVCTFVWHKPGGFQPIGLPQFNCEFALYARKGTPDFIDTKAFNTCFDAPRGKHSEKPEEFYAVVRRVTAGRRLDMFNRRPIEGFDSWGNEADG